MMTSLMRIFMTTSTRAVSELCYSDIISATSNKNLIRLVRVVILSRSTVFELCYSDINSATLNKLIYLIRLVHVVSDSVENVDRRFDTTWVRPTDELTVQSAARQQIYRSQVGISVSIYRSQVGISMSIYRSQVG